MAAARAGAAQPAWVRPAVLGLVYLVAGPTRLRTRILQLGAALAAMIAAAGWYIALVELWPAADRRCAGQRRRGSRRHPARRRYGRRYGWRRGSSDSASAQIPAWVQASFTPTTVGGQTVYDLTA